MSERLHVSIDTHVVVLTRHGIIITRLCSNATPTQDDLNVSPQRFFIFAMCECCRQHVVRQSSYDGMTISHSKHLRVQAAGSVSPASQASARPAHSRGSEVPKFGTLFSSRRWEPMCSRACATRTTSASFRRRQATRWSTCSSWRATSQSPQITERPLPQWQWGGHAPPSRCCRSAGTRPQPAAARRCRYGLRCDAAGARGRWQ